MSTKALTKAAAKRRNQNDPNLLTALQNGGPMVWLSCLIMGLGNIMAGQVIKGLLFLLVEAGIIVYLVLPTGGLHWISMLPSLGDQVMGEVYNEKTGIYEYTMGDQSQLILLYGIAALCLIALLIFVWQMAVRSGYKALGLKKAGAKIPNFADEVKSLFDENVHKLLMFAPTTCLAVFSILPLFYMMSMAFTNYSKEGDHLILFDWVGMQNFAALFDSTSTIGKQFGDVLVWTLVWAFFATFLNYILGMILAMVINRKETKGKAFWRFCFVLSIAVPQFVTLMIMNIMLQPSGAVNVLLKNLGLISESIPFWTNATYARILIIVINLWIGIPYLMLIATGILMNIPADLYESARIDGANAFQTYMKITLPYMLFVTGPYLLTSFTGNINNFNVIFLLSGGKPLSVSMAGNAGSTDLLITWLYKMTVTDSNYKLAAVMGILVFVVCAVINLVVYNMIPSVKNEEDFQ